MSWIEYHQELRDLAKVHRLAKLLGVNYPQALGHLSCLWLWAVGNARDGRLRKFDDEEIAYGGRWEGAAEKFRSALVSSGWLDGDGALHDWQEHGLRLLNSARDRMAKYRKDLLRNSSHTRSRRERKRERKKDQPVGSKEPNTGFSDFWESYPRKVGKADALKAWDKLAPDETLAKAITQAIMTQQRWPQWVKDGGQFIPHPATWLRGRRWEDQEPSRPVQRSTVPEETPAQRLARQKALAEVERREREHRHAPRFEGSTKP